MVEFGLIIAAAAIVSIAGLSAMTRAQEAYWGATTPTFASPTPSTGTFLHPTSVDAPTCSPASVLVNSTLTCTTPVVQDTYSSVSDRNPPWGVINFYLDNSSLIASCPLPSTASGSTNQCSVPSVTWTPAAANVGTHTVTARYEVPASNHVPSISGPSAPFIVHQFGFNPHPQCANELTAWMGNKVEVGSPIKCTVFVVDSGGPANNIDVTWTAPSDSMNGLRLLSCATGGQQSSFASTLWDTGSACIPASTLHCTTNSSGQCSVIYRRVRLPVGGSASLEPGDQHLTLSILSGTVNVSSGDAIQWPGPAIKVVNPAGHEVKTWMICTSTDDKVEVLPPISFGLFLANFQATGLIRIHGTSGSVSCAPTAADMQPSTALDCVSGPPPSCAGGAEPNPDRQNAHAPIGTVTLSWRAVPDPTTMCTLATRAPLAPQAPNQTPYASNCGAVTMTLNGSIGETANLIAVEAGLGAFPTHTWSLEHPTQVEFVPIS